MLNLIILFTSSKYTTPHNTTVHRTIRQHTRSHTMHHMIFIIHKCYSIIISNNKCHHLYCYHRVAAFVFRGKILVSKQAILDSVVSWTKCVFSTYDGSGHWKNVCGRAPPDRPSYTFNVFILIFISGQGVIITTIFEWNNFLNLTKKIILRLVTKDSLILPPSPVFLTSCGSLNMVPFFNLPFYLFSRI